MIIQTTGTPHTEFLSTDFSDISVLGRVIGFDCSFRPLDPGPPRIPTSLLKSEHIAVVNIRFSCGYHQCGYALAGAVSLGLPLAGTKDWFGTPYADQSILPFNQASGIDVVSSIGFEAYTLSIDEDFLRDVADTFQLPVSETLTAPSSGAVIPNSHSVQKLRGAIYDLFSQGQPLLDIEQETLLVAQLLQAGLTDGQTIDKSTPVARARALSRTLDYLDQHQGEAVSVGEICGACEIPLRTLTRAFHERFGIGPKAYLNRFRLSSVRKQLSTCEGDVLIADVANSQGFWHMGQFAGDYRRLYGELPSETVQRSASGPGSVPTTHNRQVEGS